MVDFCINFFIIIFNYGCNSTSANKIYIEGKTMKKATLAVKVVGLLVAAAAVCSLAGCSFTVNVTVPRDTSSSSSETQSEIDKYIKSLEGKQKITLPDGSTLNGSTWNGLDIEMTVMSLKSDAELTSLIGNNAEIISKEEVTTKDGSALLVLVERSQSAAEEEKSGENQHSYEYWLILRDLKDYPGRADMKLAYVITAKFTTSPDNARSNMLEIAKNWSVSD